MSLRLITRVFYSDCPASLKLLLLALADEANDEGHGVSLGQARMAQKAGCSERTVRSKLAQLAVDGWIEKLPERDPVYRTIRYRIDVEKLAGETPADFADDAPAEVAGLRAVPDASPQVSPGAEGSSAATPAEVADRQSGTAQPEGAFRLPVTTTQPSETSSLRDIAPLKPSKHQIDVMFNRFWAVYPRRKGRRGARSEFERALKRGAFTEILCGAERYRDDPERQREEIRFTAHPSTWLHQDRWTDELDDPEPPDTDALKRELGVTK